MNLPLVILPHDVTQDQREKLEIIFGIQITHLSNMNLEVNIFHQAPLMRTSLNLILLPSPKPRTFLQRKQLLQREQVLFEVVTLMVEASALRISRALATIALLERNRFLWQSGRLCG